MLEGVAAPLLRANVDTDVIIRINRLVAEPRERLGRFVFEALRFRLDGAENPQFILNRPGYRDAKILITGPNFGCGSSREAAVWALESFGIRCLIGTTFGAIFFDNCFENGILPIVVRERDVALLGSESDSPASFTVDLGEQTVTAPSGWVLGFTVEARRREALLAGLDSIGATLKRMAEIEAFEARDRRLRPWVYEVERKS